MGGRSRAIGDELLIEGGVEIFGGSGGYLQDVPSGGSYTCNDRGEPFTALFGYDQSIST